MGTPHQGSAFAERGHFLTSLWTAVLGSKATLSADQLRTFSKTLEVVTADFIGLGSDMTMLTFYEQRGIPHVGLVSRNGA